MSRKSRKAPREKDLTSRYLSGGMDEDRIEQSQRFSDRNKNAQQDKMEKTALLRAADEAETGDIASLPAGQVVQVHSLFNEVQHEGKIYLAVVRKTLAKLAETAIVVGDMVRIRPTGRFDDQGRPEAVIEQV